MKFFWWLHSLERYVSAIAKWEPSCSERLASPSNRIQGSILCWQIKVIFFHRSLYLKAGLFLFLSNSKSHNFLILAVRWYLVILRIFKANVYYLSSILFFGFSIVKWYLQNEFRSRFYQSVRTQVPPLVSSSPPRERPLYPRFICSLPRVLSYNFANEWLFPTFPPDWFPERFYYPSKNLL